MSLAKKCDCCGILYEYYTGINGISFEYLGRYGNIDKSEKTLDLCPKCMEKINNMFKAANFLKGNAK